MWQVYWHTPFPYIPHPIHRSLNDKYNDDDWGKDDDDDNYRDYDVDDDDNHDLSQYLVVKWLAS